MTTATVHRPASSQASSSEQQPPRLGRLGMFVLLLGAFLPIVDFFIVNVALPTIDATLHGSAPMLELVVSGYGVAYALLLVIGGRLGDAIGRRRVFTAGLAGFTLFSLLCGLAPSIGWLVLARLLQGCAAALIVPQVLATFHATLDGERRARALGLYGATAGIAAAVGQVLGGLLVGADIAGLSWRPIFLVNVPIGLTALYLVRRVVPATRSENPATLDLRGTALFGLALVALLVPLTEGRSLGWPWWTWVLLAASPIAAGATVLVERNVEHSGRLPLLPPSLVGLRSMRRGIGLGLPFFVGFGAFMFIFALTVQDGLHQDALRSGLTLLPLAVAFFAGSMLVPRIIGRLGRVTLGLGASMQLVGLLALIAVTERDWPAISLLDLAPGLAIAGFGQALLFGALFRLVLADVPQHLAGVGGGVMITLQQSGLALGVATLGSLFLSLEPHGVGHAFVVAVGVQAALTAAIALGSRTMPALSTTAQPAVAES